MTILLFLLLLTAGLALPTAAQQQRFPMPEFQTEYELPETTRPEPRAPGMEYMDLLVLIAVLGLTAWMVFYKRSRKWIFWLAVFALLYFGFYRKGCICSIGAIQNLSLALSGTGYLVSLSVLAFFAIPLLTALFAGRLFCASACPLGAIQDLVIIRPVRVAPWLQKTLGVIPFVYLALAVLYAATGTSFIICRYDPFIGVFRLGAPFHMALLGISFLLAGMFVGRPYCRFLCPLGALLNVCSRFSKKHLSITPKECINCKLCADSCPFGAIDHPTEGKKPGRDSFRRFVTYALLLPAFVAAGAWAVSSAHGLLSKMHPDVRLAQVMLGEPEVLSESDKIAVDTFRASDRTLDMLVADAREVQQGFKRGGRYAGGFIGLVIALTLLGQVTYRQRTDYSANRAECLSCGRCMEYCPVGKPEHPYHQQVAREEQMNTNRSTT